VGRFVAAVAGVVLALSWCGTAGADGGVPQEVTTRATGSVGLVRSAGGVGSGWVAGPDSVVTNLHVARAGSGDIYVDHSDGERVECYTAVVDRDMDLAVLRCPTGSRGWLQLATSDPGPGTPVAVVGYPGGEGPVVTRGAITGEHRVVRGIRTIGFTARIEPGSSGSPVVDELGRVLGVATFGGGLGVPAADLEPLLEVAAGYPATKLGAEWRLRARRAALAALVALPVAFVVSRRRGSVRPVRSTALGVTLAVALALAATQVQFMVSGPAHFL